MRLERVILVLVLLALAVPALAQQPIVAGDGTVNPSPQVGGTNVDGIRSQLWTEVRNADRNFYMLAPVVFSNCGQPCQGVVEDNADSALVDPKGATELEFVIFARCDADSIKAALIAHEFSVCPQVAVNDTSGPAIWTPIKTAAYETDATPTSPMPRDTIGGGFIEADWFGGGAGGGVNADTTRLRIYKNNVMPWEYPQVIYNSSLSWMPRARVFRIPVRPGVVVKWKVRHVEGYSGAFGTFTESAGSVSRIFFTGMVYARR